LQIPQQKTAPRDAGRFLRNYFRFLVAFFFFATFFAFLAGFFAFFFAAILKIIF
jgi:hypothetical protein